eukprot:TRINITY_DN18755_c0_g1_i1.p1 TRINITY_DN18755_c0_g1~~TRINITY_DN18755_c0_g1_i1.p1  ORF type:complete len:1002 (+),score=121.64 TRINITY_DN18755_c0_g1_i1:44-3007(+)
MPLCAVVNDDAKLTFGKKVSSNTACKVHVTRGVGKEEVTVFEEPHSEEVLVVVGECERKIRIREKSNVQGVGMLGDVLAIAFNKTSGGGGIVSFMNGAQPLDVQEAHMPFAPTSMTPYQGVQIITGSSVPVVVSLSSRGSHPAEVSITEWQCPSLPYDPTLSVLTSACTIAPEHDLLTHHLSPLSSGSFCVLWSRESCVKFEPPANGFEVAKVYAARCVENGVYLTGTKEGKTHAVLCTLCPTSGIKMRSEIPLGQKHSDIYTIEGDVATSTDLLLQVGSAGDLYASAVQRAGAADFVDMTAVNHALRGEGALCVSAVPGPLSMTDVTLKVFLKTSPGEAFSAEIICKSKLILRKISELEVFTCDKKAALGLIGVPEDSQDGVELLLEYLVENRLSRLIVGCISTCNIEDDYSTLRSILYWLQGKINELSMEMRTYVENKDVGTLSILKSHITQYLVIADMLLAEAEGSSCVELRASKATLECLNWQVRHVLWMDGVPKVHTRQIPSPTEQRAKYEENLTHLVESVLGDYVAVLDVASTDAPSGTDGSRVVARQLGQLASAFTTTPEGLKAKFVSLGSSVTEPPVLCYDILLQHACLTDVDNIVDADGDINAEGLYTPLKSAVLCENDKVTLKVPVGAGWVSGVVQAVNPDETFDLRTGDGSVHPGIPTADAWKQGTDEVIHKGIQHHLKLSFVYYNMLCKHGLGMRGSAERYARYEAGLPVMWVTFLKAIWCTEFGSAKEQAENPLHVLPKDVLSTMIQNDSEEDALPAITCLSLCARDLTQRAMELRWSSVMRHCNVSSALTAMERNFVNLVGTELYPKTSVSVASLAHITVLADLGSSGLAMDVVRSTKVPALAGYVLSRVISKGHSVRDVLKYSTHPVEEAALVGYLNGLRALQQSDARCATLSSRLRTADTQKLLLALYQSRHNHISMYQTANDPTLRPSLELKPIISHLETVLPNPVLKKTVPLPHPTTALFVTAKPPQRQ